MKDIYIKKTELVSWVAKYFKNDLISVDELIGKIEDLVIDIENLEEELEDLKKDMEDNFERKSISSQVGISDRDFI